ncbi:unnamed protein product [Phaeothamnion confervicola]
MTDATYTGEEREQKGKKRKANATIIWKGKKRKTDTEDAERRSTRHSSKAEQALRLSPCQIHTSSLRLSASDCMKTAAVLERLDHRAVVIGRWRHLVSFLSNYIVADLRVNTPV